MEVDVKQRILAANGAAAAELRARFRRERTLAVNLISSPGSGKTALLEATASELKSRYRLAALDGDVATERDATRLRKTGIAARQILTGGACHLDARQIREALDAGDRPFRFLDFLFIENVGNLICPTSYDLGEDFKVALLSVAEGDDKPFKYPAIFAKAAVTLITKIDALPHLPFDLDAVRWEIESLNPEAKVLTLSARSGEGMSAWYRLLEERLRAKRARAVVPFVRAEVSEAASI
jgi:hydrogenase nickel incorporation protein HypB